MFSKMRVIVKTALLVIAVSTLVANYVVADAPVPGRPPGFAYQEAPDAQVVLESFVDLICPDSRDAWQTYKDLADHYGPEKFRFSALMFPLPYHRAAMMAAQGAFVANELDPTLTYAYFDNLFSKQPALADSRIFDQPQGYVQGTLAEWAAEVGYDEQEFSTGLERGDGTHWLSRVEFKYGGTRGVFETPQTFLNGVHINSSPTWTLDDWIAIIDPLMPDDSRARRNSGCRNMRKNKC